jgi:DnaJ-class molecular chaperone
MRTAAEPSHYQTLDVPRDAGGPALRQAWRRAAQQHHPDRHGGAATAARRMAEINEAYAVLSHPERRASYDAWLRARDARCRADAAALAARPSRFSASWPWGLVAATTAFALTTVATVFYKSTVPTVAAPERQAVVTLRR